MVKNGWTALAWPFPRPPLPRRPHGAARRLMSKGGTDNEHEQGFSERGCSRAAPGLPGGDRRHRPQRPDAPADAGPDPGLSRKRHRGGYGAAPQRRAEQAVQRPGCGDAGRCAVLFRTAPGIPGGAEHPQADRSPVPAGAAGGHGVSPPAGKAGAEYAHRPDGGGPAERNFAAQRL